MAPVKNPARSPGAPTEIWVYRYDLEAKNRGSRRDLLYNAKASSGIEGALYRLFGAGRFRLEWRDSRRWIVRVRVVEIDVGGQHVQRKRTPVERVVGPAAAALPRSHVEHPPIIARSDADAVSFHGDAPVLIGPPTNVSDTVALRRWSKHLASVIVSLAKTIEDAIAGLHRKTVGRRAELLAGYLREARRARDEYAAIPASLVLTSTIAELRARCELVHARANSKIKRLRAVVSSVKRSERR